MLLTLLEMTIKPGSIRPAFYSLSVVEVVFPLTDVAFLAIHRFKIAKAVRLIVLPGPFISVTVWTPKLTLTVRLIVVPLSLVLSLIGPALHSVATLFAFLVYITRVESVLHDLYVFNILQLMLLDHLAQFGYLIPRPAIETLEVFLACSYQLLLLLQA